MPFKGPCKKKSYMDYVRHGEIQGHYSVFFKAYGSVFYHDKIKSPFVKNEAQLHNKKYLPINANIVKP